MPLIKIKATALKKQLNEASKNRATFHYYLISSTKDRFCAFFIFLKIKQTSAVNILQHLTLQSISESGCENDCHGFLSLQKTKK